MTEPVAHMLPSDLARFATSETTGTAFSVAAGTPDEKSVPLYTVPIDMVLHCPNCGAQHIDSPMTDEQYTERLHESSWWECGGDKPERWSNPPHRSHQCHYCKGPDGKPFVWRPADVATNGVEAVKTRGKDDSPLVDRKGYDGDRP